MVSIAGLISTPSTVEAFDGGVGGLGKTKPDTGVVFRDSEIELTQSSRGSVSAEVVAPDGTAALLSFEAPYPLLKTTSGIEARDLGGFESSFVQVVELPKGTMLDSMKPNDFGRLVQATVMGSRGKFGAYGVPSDVKLARVNANLYKCKFTVLTPAMVESDRSALIAARQVGTGIFLLISTTTSARFKKQEGLLRSVSDSFSVVRAPDSALRKK